MTPPVSLREGFSVLSTEEARLSQLRLYQESGVITVGQVRIQQCKKCGANNEVDADFASTGLSTCRACSATLVLSTKSEKRYIIETVNRLRLVELVGKKVANAVGTKNCMYDKSSRSWMVRIQGGQIPVFLSQVSSYNTYLDKDGKTQWLCVLLDWEAEKGVVNHYNSSHFVSIEDILLDRADLGEKLMLLGKSFTPNPIISLSESFDKFLSSITPAYFERSFVDDLLRSLKDKSSELTYFLNFLTAMRDTIVNTKVLLIGGPGREDFVTLNLLEYLQEGLKPNKVGEAKRYCRTRFTVQDFGVAEVHAADADTVYILSTNNIQTEVWDSIWGSYRRQGYFRQVIFDRDIILLLVQNLGLEGLFRKTKP